jgi:filamentous hemagglutinin family protein
MKTIWQQLAFQTGCLSGGILLLSQHLLAQVPPVTTDKTLPNPSVITENDQVITINGGTQAGSNLFHSFKDFSVPTNREVLFNNDSAINRIISRVTGSSISSIDGLIKANGRADFFLINPNGIVFNDNASLDIGGSVIFSTAEAITFEDGLVFSARNPQNSSILSINIPVGVQFGRAANSITVNNVGELRSRELGASSSSLQIQPQKTFALIGGELVMDGALIEAGGGRIELGSVEKNNLVNLEQVSDGWRLKYDSVNNFQDIRISNLSTVATNGESGGNIQIRGKDIQLKLVSAVISQTLGESSGGIVEIRGQNVLLEEGGLISISTESGGNGGDLLINASDAVTLTGSAFFEQSPGVRNPSGLFARTRGSGDAGEIRIQADQLFVRDGSRISVSSGSRMSEAEGNGGRIVINASDLVEVSGITPDEEIFPSRIDSEAVNGTGNGGRIEISTRNLVVRNGGVVSSATGVLGSTGQGGTLTIDTQNSVEITGIATTTEIIDGENQTFSFPSTIEASTQGAGNAGNLVVETENLFVSNGAEMTVSGAELTEDLPEPGAAGNLEIISPFLELNNESALRANTAAGGGNININSSDLRLRRGSQITTDATGEAEGGNIFIDTNTLTALENSDITANAEQASGGQVRITAQGVFGTEFREQETEQSDITASSELGAQFSGVVEISTPDVDPSQGLVQLPENVVDVSTLIEQGCAVANASSFTVVGKGGLPPSPSDNLSSDTLWVDLGEQLPQSATSQFMPPSTTTDQSSLVEAQGWIRGENGNIILTADPQQVNPQRSRQPAQDCSPTGS